MTREAARARLLVVDDDAEIRSLLSDRLEAEGYHVIQAADAAGFACSMRANEIDLIILDLTLPGADGIDLCRDLRKGSRTPVIMLTARGDPQDRIAGLDVGADDYLCKPFEPDELLARIRAVLRRSETLSANELPNARRLAFGEWTLDIALRRLVGPGGGAVILSATEFRLLRILLDHAGEVLSREAIIAMGGSHGVESQDRSVDLQISRIRTKLGDNRQPYRYIVTERQRGYCFIAPVQRC